MRKLQSCYCVEQTPILWYPVPLHRAKVPLGLPTKVHPVEITSKRQENDEEDEDHHRNFNAACSALWQFSSKLLSILFEAWQGMRESPFLWWAFIYMTVKSRIWWAFLTGTAMEYREVALKSNARRSYCLISMCSNDTPIAHRGFMQFHDTGSRFWWF